VIAALRTTLSVVFVVLACWLGTPSPASAAPTTASAADCDMFDLSNPSAVRERADAVTDVFAGQVRAAEPRTTVGGGEGKANPDSTDPPSNKPDVRTTAWEHTVVVQVPFRSSQQPGDRVLVVTEPTADDGLGRLEVDATYLFFVSGDEGMDHLVAEACSGTQKLQGGLGAGLRDALHRALDEPTDEDTPLDFTLAVPEDGVRSTPSLGRLAAPGAAVALIGVLGLLLVARIGARRA